MRNSAPQGVHKAGVGDTEILGEEVSPDLQVPPSLSAREESRQQNGQSGRAAARPPEQEEKGLHDLEAANVLLARSKDLISMIPVLVVCPPNDARFTRPAPGEQRARGAPSR
jgi:hypothetical protein